MLLANARVIDEESAKADHVEVGSKVTIREGDNEPETYTIVGPAEANPREGRISNEVTSRAGADRAPPRVIKSKWMRQAVHSRLPSLRWDNLGL